MIEFWILTPKGIRIGFLDSAYPPLPLGKVTRIWRLAEWLPGRNWFNDLRLSKGFWKWWYFITSHSSSKSTIIRILAFWADFPLRALNLYRLFLCSTPYKNKVSYRWWLPDESDTISEKWILLTIPVDSEFISKRNPKSFHYASTMIDIHFNTKNLPGKFQWEIIYHQEEVFWN